MYPQQGGWPAQPAPPKKPSRAPLLLIPLVFGVVGALIAVASLRGRAESDEDSGPAPTLPPVVAPPTNPPAAQNAAAPVAAVAPTAPIVHAFGSRSNCGQTAEWITQLRAAYAINATTLRCVTASGAEGPSIPIGRDGVRGASALAMINHHVLVMETDRGRRAILAGFRNATASAAPVDTALAQPMQAWRMNALFETTIASSGPVAGMNVYRFTHSDGRIVLGLDSNPGSPLFVAGQRVRVYGVWGVKDGGAVVFPFWFEVL